MVPFLVFKGNGQWKPKLTRRDGSVLVWWPLRLLNPTAGKQKRVVGVGTGVGDQDRDRQRPERRGEREGCCVLREKEGEQGTQYRKMSLGKLLFFYTNSKI